jgi:hypothetical protein
MSILGKCLTFKNSKSFNVLSKKYLFPLMAFLVPLFVRCIPEILMGPYLVGFDTMAFYVPDVTLWLHNGINLWGLFLSAPLFFAILFSIVASGGPLILVLKIIPPLLLGFLGLSIYVYARKGLDWSPLKSIVPALLGTVYFVALRVSWDQFRNELGLVFFFSVLTLLSVKKPSSWKRYFLLSLSMVAVSLSHQLVAVIMFGIVAFTVVDELFRKKYGIAVNLVVVSLPALLFLILNYLGNVASGFIDYSTNLGSPLASWTGFTSYSSMLMSEAGFFLYCFLPLLPLVMISLKGFRNLQMRSWLLFSFILLLIPLASVSPFRWVLMLTYPLVFYATETLSRLKSVKWKRFNFTICRVALAYLVLSTIILSFGFILATPENPIFYFKSTQNNGFNSYINEIPSSMLENTLSVSDCQDTVNVVHWFKDNLNSSALLLTHTAFYSWAILALGPDQVTDYGFDNPAIAAATAAQQGHTQIFLIWWVDGQGWYGLPTVPSSFEEVYRSGRIAIYNYTL